MTARRIVCTEQSTPKGSGHKHITAVGVGDDPNRASTRENVTHVRAALSSGDSYYSVGSTSGAIAFVHPVECLRGINTIRSTAYAVPDNDLDSLRPCRDET